MDPIFDSEIDAKLGADIKRLMDLVRKIRDNGELQLFSALFQTDFQILSYLSVHKDCHPSDMADALKVTRPNIAANLRNLENKEYIERNVDKDNRRQVYVNLTDKGKQYIELCNIQLSYLFASWFKILGEEDTQHLFQILEKSSSPDLMTDSLRSFNLGE